MPPRESLGRSNKRFSKTSQACCGHPRYILNLLRLSFPLTVFGLLCAFPHPRGRTYLQFPSHIVLYQIPGPSAAVLKPLAMPNTRQSSASHSVHFFCFLPGIPAFFSSPYMIILSDQWFPMWSSALDRNNFIMRTVTVNSVVVYLRLHTMENNKSTDFTYHRVSCLYESHLRPLGPWCLHDTPN